MKYITEAAIEALTWIACTVVALAIFFGVNDVVNGNDKETCTYVHNDVGLVVQTVCS